MTHPKAPEDSKLEYINNWKNYRSEKPCAVTLGKFDGVHRGHQKLIWRVEELAWQKEWKAAAYTFITAPGMLRAGRPAKLLMTNDERREFLRETGLDLVMATPFNEELRNMEAEAFVTEILAESLQAKAVIVGPDFRFGKDRKGDPDFLIKMGPGLGFDVEILPKEQEQGVDISSTLIRREILAGHMEQAKVLLGYPYYVTGEIVHGKHLGHSLGFPTINQVPDEEKLLPPKGVYASRACVAGQCIYGMSNIGYKPTVKGDALGIETHLFGFSGDLYGMDAKIQLLSFLRPEQKFDSVEELRSQLERDRQSVLDRIGKSGKKKEQDQG